jgi:hypothetical protein
MSVQIIKDYLRYLIKNKKYWLIPIILVLLIIGIFVVFTESSIIAPFIYALF